MKFDSTNNYATIKYRQYRLSIIRSYVGPYYFFCGKNFVFIPSWLYQSYFAEMLQKSKSTFWNIYWGRFEIHYYFKLTFKFLHFLIHIFCKLKYLTYLLYLVKVGKICLFFFRNSNRKKIYTLSQGPEVQFTYKVLQSTFDQTGHYFRSWRVQKWLSETLLQ